MGPAEKFETHREGDALNLHPVTANAYAAVFAVGGGGELSLDTKIAPGYAASSPWSIFTPIGKSVTSGASNGQSVPRREATPIETNCLKGEE